jgi:hypothetical protein
MLEQMQLDGQIARMEGARNLYGIFVEKPLSKWPLEDRKELSNKEVNCEDGRVTRGAPPSC